MRLFDFPGGEAVILAMVIGASVGGTYFAVWRQSRAGSIFSAALLVLISGSLAVFGGHPVGFGAPAISNLALVAGIAFGLSFPCCAPHQRIGAMQVAGGAVVLGHCLLDGHVVREVGTVWLLALLIAHKFQDGADSRLLSSDNRTVQIVLRAAVIFATPVGYLFIPEKSVNPLLHASLFAAVIGLNLGSAFHLVRHAMHVGHEAPAGAESAPT